MDSATSIALESLVDQYVQGQVHKAQQADEDDFLYGRFGREFLGLQRMPEVRTGEKDFWWFYNGNVGNDPNKIGPGNPVASYHWTPGDPATLSTSNYAKDWAGVANVYFYMKLPTPSALPHRIVDSRTFLIQDLSGWQALEFQSQITMNGLTYNMAWQANIASKMWRYFDYTNTKWIPIVTVMPVPDFSKPVTLAAEFALDGQSTTHVALTINGTKYPVGIKQAATAIADKSAAKFTTAVQIDPKPSGSCSLQISQHNVRYL